MKTSPSYSRKLVIQADKSPEKDWKQSGRWWETTYSKKTDDQETTRQTIVKQLRQSHQEKYTKTMLQKPEREDCPLLHRERNQQPLPKKWLCNWHFIHRARLDCIPLNATRRFGYNKETLPHVLRHCKIHSAAWQHQHNSIQERIVTALPIQDCEVAVNKQYENMELRPDIVYINKRTNTAWVLDITVPFENTQ